MSGRRRPVSIGTAALALAACLLTAPVGAAGLTEPTRLARAYDLILDARFDDAERELRRVCDPLDAAPDVSCQVLQAVSQYWQVLFDQENTSLDGAVMAKADAAVGAAEAWAARDPQRAEAWFYLGGAYGTRVLMRGLRNEILPAARDGRRIHDSLQRAVSLDPTLQDAYFGLGLYHYYAAVAPVAARVLRWLFFLPGGNRTAGLEEMTRTQHRGLLLRGEADYQLQLIYLWYERQPATALRLAESLRARYPHNPLFPLRVAIIQSEYFHDAQASLGTYRSLLASAESGRVAYPEAAAITARLGMAQQMERRCERAAAIEQLDAVIARKPAAPYASLARAYLQLGTAYDGLGRRRDAINAYRSALAAMPPDDRLRMSDDARERIARAPIARACR